MAKIRTIKKYPNRRLYDTHTSQYFTLKAIRDLVVSAEEFIVIDAKTGDDITRNILLQIIAEQEHDGEPLFATEILTHLIRFYDHPMQSMAVDYIQQCVEFFVSQQTELQQQFNNTLQNPFSSMTEMTAHNMNLWKKMQENLFQLQQPFNKQDKD